MPQGIVVEVEDDDSIHLRGAVAWLVGEFVRSLPSEIDIPVSPIRTLLCGSFPP